MRLLCISGLCCPSALPAAPFRVRLYYCRPNQDALSPKHAPVIIAKQVHFIHDNACDTIHGISSSDRLTSESFDFWWRKYHVDQRVCALKCTHSYVNILHLAFLQGGAQACRRHATYMAPHSPNRVKIVNTPTSHAFALARIVLCIPMLQ